ncbi:MAG TPA: hypothetical protein VFR15_06910, partial [Chloroflexia bacterium]|nr:hypothetical protein [Chloroflexia bacterium]
STGDELYFESTGFAVSGSFRELWEQPGNAEALGRPVSGVFLEAGEGGVPLRVQYFERGAMRRLAGDQTAPAAPAPLGAERYRALHGAP